MLSFKIATRFLRKSLSQTILIVIGIAVGVSVQIFIGSLISGLQDSLINVAIGDSSQITIKSDTADTYFSGYASLEDTINQDIAGLSAVSAALDYSGNIIVDTESAPILLRGMEISKAEDIYELESKKIEGVMPIDNGDILLGTTLATSLGIKTGDTVNFSFPLVGDKVCKVVGLFDFNVEAVNKAWIITTLSSAQTLLEKTGKVSSIEMQVEDVFLADEIAQSIADTIGSNYIVTNWKVENAELLSGLKAQDSSTLLIQVFVSISVILAIASILAITVVQKSKQIGILKAMGLKNGSASLIFLYEGLLLGAMGAIAGVLLGLFLNFAFTTFALDSTGAPVIPITTKPNLIVIIALIAVASSCLASLIPARKSSKLTVIEVIKNG